jgi:DNA-binding PadR family transcriptional regulator
MSKGNPADQKRSEALQDTPRAALADRMRAAGRSGRLDLMVLKTMDAMGPLHGYGIARRIEQLSEDVLQLNEGTVYTSLLRLQQQDWIASSWGCVGKQPQGKILFANKGRT